MPIYLLFLTLFISLLLSCCTTAACRSWQLQEIVSKNGYLNCGRLILTPDNQMCPLELELTRNYFGTQLYLNIQHLQAYPCKDNPLYTEVEIQFSTEESQTTYLRIFEGGQRLQFSDDMTQKIVQFLLEDQTLTIRLGRNYLTVVPLEFVKCYSDLLKISILEPPTYKN